MCLIEGSSKTPTILTAELSPQNMSKNKCKRI